MGYNNAKNEMKSIEKIQKVVENMGYMKLEGNETAEYYRDECMRLLREFMADNVTVPKSELRCKDFVLADKSMVNIRPTMFHIYHDEEAQMAVATDAHAIFASTAEYVPTDMEKYKGMRDIYGEPVEGLPSFPNWAKVLPQYTEPVTMRPDIEDAMKAAVAECKLQGKTRNAAAVCVDGIHWIAYRFMATILKAGLDGWEGAKLQKNGEVTPNRCIIKKWDGKILLIMPLMIEDEDHPMAEEERQRGWRVNPTY